MYIVYGRRLSTGKEFWVDAHETLNDAVLNVIRKYRENERNNEVGKFYYYIKGGVLDV